MDANEIARRLADGGRVHELSALSGRTFRLFGAGNTRIVKFYPNASAQRREHRALEALAGVDGIPKVIEWGEEDDQAWAVFVEPGHWNLASLPASTSAARQAGVVLRAVHGVDPSGITNLAGGMDEDWLRSEYRSVFSRLVRYRRRATLPKDTLDAAMNAPAPIATDPVIAHTNPRPDRFIVDEETGNVTLADWVWATAAPPEWDYSLAVWTMRMIVGETAAESFTEGYGRMLPSHILKPWIAFHAGSTLLREAEQRDGRLDDLQPIVDELESALS